MKALLRNVWQPPDAAEASIYEVVDGVDQPPTLARTRVVYVRDIYVALERGAASRAHALGALVRINRRSFTCIPRELVEFTPAAAWAGYIERQENHIEDLEQEIELRRTYLKCALTEHVKVGPSGPSAEAP